MAINTLGEISQIGSWLATSYFISMYGVSWFRSVWALVVLSGMRLEYYYKTGTNIW